MLNNDVVLWWLKPVEPVLRSNQLRTSSSTEKRLNNAFISSTSGSKLFTFSEQLGGFFSEIVGFYKSSKLVRDPDPDNYANMTTAAVFTCWR